MPLVHRGGPTQLPLVIFLPSPCHHRILPCRRCTHVGHPPMPQPSPMPTWPLLEPPGALAHFLLFLAPPLSSHRAIELLLPWLRRPHSHRAPLAPPLCPSGPPRRPLLLHQRTQGRARCFYADAIVFYLGHGRLPLLKRHPQRFPRPTELLVGTTMSS